MATHRPCFVVLSSSLSMSHITCPTGRSMTIREVKDLTQWLQQSASFEDHSSTRVNNDEANMWNFWVILPPFSYTHVIHSLVAQAYTSLPVQLIITCYYMLLTNSWWAPLEELGIGVGIRRTCWWLTGQGATEAEQHNMWQWWQWICTIAMGVGKEGIWHTLANKSRKRGRIAGAHWSSRR